MSTHSTDGRPWAKSSELKPGDKLRLDDGFAETECGLEDNSVVSVERDNGGLYFNCHAGHHYLAGQLSKVDNDSLVGVWRE